MAKSENPSANRYLVIPGLAGSGPTHWQSLWEKLYPDQFVRVEQDNWDWPEKDRWVDRLEETISRQDGPVILVGHSLGCITLAHWSTRFTSGKVAGAFLVAPADADLSRRLSFIKDFAPVPTAPLPFPSYVIASTNDIYMTIGRAKHFAEKWGSTFFNIGEKGHINAASELEDWKDGQQLLEQLTRKAIPEWKTEGVAGKGPVRNLSS